MVGVTSIYDYIHKNKASDVSLYKHFRHQLKYRKRMEGGNCIIKDRVSVDERPAVEKTRSRFGDWEIDTIVGKEGKGP